MSEKYSEMTGRLREAQTLISVAELLGWDQETMMPGKAAAFRAEEMSLLSRLAHEREAANWAGEDGIPGYLVREGTEWARRSLQPDGKN